MRTQIILWICLAGFYSVSGQNCGEGDKVGYRCVTADQCTAPRPPPPACDDGSAPPCQPDPVVPGPGGGGDGGGDPDGDPDQCSTYADIGYSCVNFDACIFGGFTRRRLSLEERKELAESSLCGCDDEICCHDTEIDEDSLEDVCEGEPGRRSASARRSSVNRFLRRTRPTTKRRNVFDDLLCRDVNDPDESDPLICCPEEYIKTCNTVQCEAKAAEGYGCHEISDCDPDSIDVNAVCGDPRRSSAANNCCVPKAQPPPGGSESCADITALDENFQCTEADNCNIRFCPRLVNTPAQALIDRAKDATCPNGGVCCHFNDFEEVPFECGEDDGDFQCVNKEECIDQAFPNIKNSQHKHGYCRGNNDICCKKVKPAEEVQSGDECAGSGYRCRLIEQCDLTSPILKKGSDNLLNAVQIGCNRFVNLTTEVNKCEEQDEVCCKGTSPDPCESPNPPPACLIRNPLDVCGKRNPNGLSLTSTDPQDGEEGTQFGEWPFTCLVYGNGNKFLGGASLIAPGVLLTAAHILTSDNPGDFRARCGEWDTSRRVESLDTQQRDIESISVHPQYHKRKLYHDVALLHTTEDFVLAGHVNTICLPPLPFEDFSNFDVTGCVVTGWGERAEDPRGTPGQPIMKAVHDIPIVEHSECEDKLKTINGRFRLHESFVCAGGERGIDACQGDGGGPLACPIPNPDADPALENRYRLAGVVAGGVGGECGKEGIPGAYASVEKELCFIHWATACKEGETYKPFYWYPECEFWLEDLEDNDELRGRGQQDAADELRDQCVPDFRRKK